MVNVVIGSQWGDEGKGKFTDVLASESDIVARFQGGNNAGHTIIINDNEFKLHLIPSGIIAGKVCVIGNGVVVDFDALFEEIEYLERKGIVVNKDNLKISDRAHVIIPYHKTLDNYKESLRGDNKIGTTGKGIGTCYADKVERSGIRVIDILGDTKELTSKIQAIYDKLPNNVDLQPIDIAVKLKTYGRMFKENIIDTSVYLHEELKKGKKILAEGGQGMLLDIDHGTYPFVTSSNTTTGGVLTGLGVSFKQIDKVYGVAKAYTTRVGEGAFPTELDDETGKWIQKIGKEVGVTTGRSRRCGWLDLVILKSSARVNGYTDLILTKIDTLAGLEIIKVCVGYELDGVIIDYIPARIEDFAKCKPLYTVMKGWTKSDIEKIKNQKNSNSNQFNNLPKAIEDYLDLIKNVVGVPVTILSFGADRSDTLRNDNLL